MKENKTLNFRKREGGRFGDFVRRSSEAHGSKQTGAPIVFSLNALTSSVSISMPSASADNE